MRAIFYDLETSDKNTVGQILNYCFIEVDKHLEPLRTLSNKIRISRLQLPMPEAILANRTDVLQHQEEATLSECEALLEIHQFISEITARSRESVPLVGYNSSRFDLPYLRTSFIRNGLNPYFGGRIVNRDLLFAVRKLAATRRDFPRPLAPKKSNSESEEPRLSLSLESVCKQLSILHGKQSHESVADVLLTINLARHLRDSFGLNILEYEGYEALAFHNRKGRGDVFHFIEPNYALASKDIAIRIPMTLLDANHRYALWIDLARYGAGAGRSSIFWCNQGGSCLLSSEDHNKASVDEELSMLANKALKEFSGVYLNNFFSQSTCDVEQDIYRIDFDGIDALRQAIWQGDKKELSDTKVPDLKMLFSRHKMKTYQWGGAHDNKMGELLRAYALHRYGGKMQLSKNLRQAAEGPTKYQDFHPTLSQMLQQISDLLKECTEEQRALLQSLREFYYSSDIYKVAGTELGLGDPALI